MIAAGAGNDTVTYRGTESSIDGGADLDTLILAVSGGTTAINLSVAAGSDQTTGDTVNTTNFENVDASALGSALTVTGSSAANTITTGSGNDTIDGGGGADVIVAGVGNDSVAYYGSETSIDGGTGTNTLMLRAAGTINLGNVDQSSGDSANVTNFQNVDASALSMAASITGSSSANTITGGSGNDSYRRRRRRRHHCRRRRQRYGDLPRHRKLDQRRRRHRYAGPGRVRRHHRDQFCGCGRFRPDRRRRRHHHEF